MLNGNVYAASALPPVLICHSSVLNYYTSPAEPTALAACNDFVTWYNGQWPVFAVNLISCDPASQTMVVGSWFAPPASYFVGCKAQNTCPAHASGTPCACDAGYVADSTGACVPETISLILSGGATTIEPWNKMHDPSHTQGNVLFMAIVVNNLGTPKPNYPVTINSDVTANSGGHHHIDGRPKGKLLETTDGIEDALSALTVNTDNQGMATFYFGAEEASGEHTITATCDKCTNSPRTAKVNVEIAGLEQLDKDKICTQYFALQGGKETHPDNHYFSPNAFAQMYKLGAAYEVEYGELLLVNDSSLIKGGLYDLKNNWTKSHKGHRKGAVVDINNFHERDTDFEQFVADQHAFAKWEGLDVSPTPHYHIRLLGKNRDE